MAVMGNDKPLRIMPDYFVGGCVAQSPYVKYVSFRYSPSPRTKTFFAKGS